VRTETGSRALLSWIRAPKILNLRFSKRLPFLSLHLCL
jgi:hypothetical protein